MEPTSQQKTGFQQAMDEHLERIYGNYRRNNLTLTEMDERDKYQTRTVYNAEQKKDEE